MRVWYFIAYAYNYCSLNMHGHEPSVPRSRFDFVMQLYLHPFCVEEWSSGGSGETVCMHNCVFITGVLMTVQYLLNIL